jgi:hypothetical protein
VIYIRSGQPQQAQAATAAIKRISPQTTLEHSRKTIPFKDPAVLDSLLADLGKAGLK